MDFYFLLSEAMASGALLTRRATSPRVRQFLEIMNNLH